MKGHKSEVGKNCVKFTTLQCWPKEVHWCTRESYSQKSLNPKALPLPASVFQLHYTKIHVYSNHYSCLNNENNQMLAASADDDPLSFSSSIRLFHYFSHSHPSFTFLQFSWYFSSFTPCEFSGGNDVPQYIKLVPRWMGRIHACWLWPWDRE